MEIIFFFLSSELLDKNASIRSKLPTAACWSREITEENLKQTCFMSKAKATSAVPQLGNHSQYSSHVGALNLIDESKSLPVEANNSTIKLHLPVEAKEKIVMIDESKSLPVEANNSTIVLHLPVEAKEKIAMIDVMSQNLCPLRQIVQPSCYIWPLRRKKSFQSTLSRNLCPLR